MEMKGKHKVGYAYYVVYEVWKDGRIVGKGCCDVGLRKKISKIENVREIAKLISKDRSEDDGQVVIVNWILMGEFKYGG